MPLVIRTETMAAAPDRGSNSRTTVGVGESVLFRTAPVRAAHWTYAGIRTRTPQRDQAYTFTTPGEHTVEAEADGERGTARIRVVVPSLRYEKVSEPTVPSGVTAWLARNGRPTPPALAPTLLAPSVVGVAMELRILLTPLSVSFAGLQVREGDCTPTAKWGAYSTHTTAPPHTATPTWTNVEPGNVLQFHDLAAACWIPSRLTWPIPAGGYRWDIPVEYRLGEGGAAVRFAAVTPETVRYDPLPGPAGAHSGIFSVNKGGCSATARV